MLEIMIVQPKSLFVILWPVLVLDVKKKDCAKAGKNPKGIQIYYCRDCQQLFLAQYKRGPAGPRQSKSE